MDTNTLALYVHEMRNQCVYTEAALGLFNQAMDKQMPVAIFAATQDLLTSSSLLARLLFPPRIKSRRRAELLRQALGIAENHPLNDRRLTQIWDYADERTEDWMARSKGQKVLFDFIGPRANAGEPDLTDANIYRMFDPETRFYYYRGEIFNLQALATAVADIAARVNQLHAQFFPQHHQQAAAATAPAAPALQPEAETAAETA